MTSWEMDKNKVLPYTEPWPSQRCPLCPYWQQWRGFQNNSVWSFEMKRILWDPPVDTNSADMNEHFIHPQYAYYMKTRACPDQHKLGSRRSNQRSRLTSLRDFRVLRLGLNRTSLKSSLTSLSMWGMLGAKGQQKVWGWKGGKVRIGGGTNFHLIFNWVP